MFQNCPSRIFLFSFGRTMQNMPAPTGAALLLAAIQSRTLLRELLHPIPLFFPRKCSLIHKTSLKHTIALFLVPAAPPHEIGALQGAVTHHISRAPLLQTRQARGPAESRWKTAGVLHSWKHCTSKPSTATDYLQINILPLNIQNRQL